MNKTIVAIYTGKGLADPLQKVINATLPDFRLITIIDDQLIGECKAAGKVPQSVEDRLMTYFHCAEEMGADVILNTCSSVGDVVYKARETMKTPIVRIDEAMARKAVAGYKKIAVVATLATTCDPSKRLVPIEADTAGNQLENVYGLAEGAFDALASGHPEQHDALLKQTVMRLAEQKVECILLAQGSMARMEQELRDAVPGVAVFASPQLCADSIKEMFA